MTAARYSALIRTYLCLQILAVWMLGITDARSMAHAIAQEAGWFGWWLLFAQAFVALLGLADAVVNDWLPDKYVLGGALDFRHHVFMVLAMLFGLQMYLCAHIAEAWSAIPYYLLQCAVLVVAAYMDVVDRYRGARRA